MASSCSIPTFEQTVNFIKNKDAGIYQITGDVSQGDIAALLDHTHAHIQLNPATVTNQMGDDGLRYSVVNPATSTFSDVVIKWRATDKLAMDFRRNRTAAEVAAIRNNSNNIIKRDYGTATHGLLQKMGELRHNHLLSGVTEDLTSFYLEGMTGEYKFNKDDINKLYAGATETIDKIWETQKSIDPTVVPIIKFENVVVDPVRDTAGTMDVVAIYSDRTASIVDYKTVSPRATYIKGTKDKRELTSADFIDPSVQEKWKTQLSIYKRILLTYYGVKDVRSTRVVPVWTDINGTWDSTNQVFNLDKSLNQVQMGRKQSEHLRNVVAGFEKTVIAPIDELIEDNYQKIKRIKDRTKSLPSDERYAAVQKIRDLELAILDLTEDKDIEHLLNATMSEITEIYARYQQNPSSVTMDELNHAIDSIQSLSQFDIATQEMIETMKKQDLALYSNIRQVFRKNSQALEGLRQILSVFSERRMELVLDEIGDSDGRFRKDGAELLMKEDGFFTQMFLPTSNFENPLVRRAGYIFEEAYEKSRQDLRAIQMRLEPAEEQIRAYAKRTGLSLTSIYKMMINPATGDFYSKLDSKFFAEREVAKTNRDVAFFVKNYKIRDKNRFGETYADWFDRTHDEQKAMLENSYSWMSPVQQMDRVNREMDIWISNNNLLLGMNKVPMNPDAWMRNNGWLTISDAAMNQYQSEQWKNIQNTPELLSYYNAITSVIDTLRPIVGYTNVKNSSFLPKVRAEFMEKLNQGGMGYLTDSAQGLGEDLRNIFSIREGDTTFGQMDYTTGKIDKSIPIFFTNLFKDADGKVDITQQSLDISRTIRVFAHMAYTHQYLKKSEAEIVAIKEILKKVKYYEQSETGQKVFNFMHNIAVKDKSEGGTMTDKVMSNLVDYHLYGIKVQPFQGKPKLTKGILRAKQYFTLKVLGLGFIPAGASYVSARMNAIFEGGKALSYSEKQWKSATMNQVNNFKKYEALGYFFGIHTEGEVVDLVSERTKGHTIFKNPAYSPKVLQYINERALMRPFSYGDERIDNHISNAMALNYGIDSEGNVRRLANLPEGTKSIWELFSVDDQGTISFAGTDQQILQFKRAARAAQRGIKGTANSEDIAYAQTDLILNVMMQFKTWMPGVLNERFSALKYNDILDAPQWGRYKAILNETELKASANTATYILKTTANTLYFLSKNLLLYNRLTRLITGGSVKLNDELNQREYAKYLGRGGNARVTYADFLAIKRGQIKAMITELEVLLLFSAMIFGLGADWDDDGEALYQEGWLLQKMYQTANRVKTELTFSYDPMSYTTLVASPIPLASMAVDFARLINNTLDEMGDTLFGEDTVRLGIPFGANKGGDNDPKGKFHYSMGLIPGGYQLRRLFNLTESDQKAIK